MSKKHERETEKKPDVGEWAGDGHWAGSSPSAPKTAGPLTGDRASGELAPDVEPTGLGSGPVSSDASGQLHAVPAGGATGPGQVGGEYREPVPAEPDAHHPPRQEVDDLHDVHGGQPVVRKQRDRDVAAESTAGPDKGRSSDPNAGRQEAGRPGPHRPDKAQPREGGVSYDDAVEQSERTDPDGSAR